MENEFATRSTDWGSSSVVKSPNSSLVTGITDLKLRTNVAALYPYDCIDFPGEPYTVSSQKTTPPVKRMFISHDWWIS